MRSAPRFARGAALALALALALGSTGCVVHGTATAEPVYVSTPPPQPVYVEAYSCPAGHYYVEGYQHWNGYAWVYVEPQCVYKPGYVWVTPAYVTVSGGVKYKPGYWKAAPPKKKAVHHGKPPKKKVIHSGQPTYKSGPPPAKVKHQGKPVHKGKPVQ